MKVNIRKPPRKFHNVCGGDILIFTNGEMYDHYIVVYNPFKPEYYMLCPETSQIMEEFNSLEELEQSVNTPKDGFYLVNTINKNDVELRVIDND